MARIAGVDLPRRKHLAFALPYLYGIGPKTARDICTKTGIPHNKRVEELSDGMRITPAPLHGTEIETYNDHRMAMSFALAGMRIPGVTIRNPGCAAKTYPRFFEDLKALTKVG